MIKRRKSRIIKVGGLKIGGGTPVSIQSMTKVKTEDTGSVIAEIKTLQRHGCQIVRVAVKDASDAKAIRKIKKKITIPIVADIHFDHRLALSAIDSGVDKIRINPGNITKQVHLNEIIRSAKKRKIPIRIGINSGSIQGALRGEDTGHKTWHKVHSPESFVSTALRYIKLFEKKDFRDIIISLKSSDVTETVDAYRKLAPLCDYPFHLGVTAAGTYESGIVKSSIGIGSLLLDGIGDTIRVSLTGNSVKEVAAAKNILQSLRLRKFGPDIISCPTCGRCQVDLKSVVEGLEKELSAIRFQPSAGRPITVAVMGCEVNGPGEAREANIGIACGKGTGMLFKQGKVIRKIAEKDITKELIKQIKLSADI